MTDLRMLFPDPAKQVSSRVDRGRVRRTCVCHRSIGVSQWISIPEKFRLERTTEQFPHVEYRMQCYDSLTDLAKEPNF